MSRELFELSILGGAPQRQYRALRPQAEEMPWGTLPVAGFSADELEQARRCWTDLALQEYASAASQANALRLVLRARAPLDLSAILTPFPLDELLHTELCARMANELGGTTPLLYEAADVFPEPQASAADSPLLCAARAVVWEFCVGETLSHGLLVSHATRAEHPLVRAVWQRLARDEAAHAGFGWTFMDWALSELSSAERTGVAAMAALAMRHATTLDDKVRSLPPAAFTAIGTFGPDRDAYIALGQSLLRERVRERLASLGLA